MTLVETLRRDPRVVDRICHELRRPLSIITAYAEVLEDRVSGPLQPEQAEQVSRIRRGAAQLGRTVADFFDTFHLLLHGVAAPHGRIVWEELLETALAEAARALEVESIDLIANPLPALPAFVADAEHLGLALSRLLRHAAAHLAREERLRLRAELSAGVLRVEIDTPGASLTEEELGQVFEFLHRPPGGRRGSEPGGAPLSVCRAAVELLGGSVRALAGAEAGVTYRLEVPVCTEIGE